MFFGAKCVLCCFISLIVGWGVVMFLFWQGEREEKRCELKVVICVNRVGDEISARRRFNFKPIHLSRQYKCGMKWARWTGYGNRLWSTNLSMRPDARATKPSKFYKLRSGSSRWVFVFLARWYFSGGPRVVDWVFGRAGCVLIQITAQ